jgi:hypothetical protein
MVKRCRFFGIAVLSAAAVFGQATPTGSISGSVQTVDGKPVGKAIVAIVVRPSLASPPSAPFNTAVLTAADGGFRVTGVPNGTYAVCPYLPNSNLVAPCYWGKEPTVTLSKGEAATVPAIPLPQGADLYIRVNDLNGTRAAVEGKTPGASLLLTVRTVDGRHIMIPQSASGQQGFDHHLTVPVGKDLLVMAYSKTYTMTDQSGKAIDKNSGLKLTINIPQGQAQHKETIEIH